MLPAARLQTAAPFGKNASVVRLVTRVAARRGRRAMEKTNAEKYGMVQMEHLEALKLQGKLKPVTKEGTAKITAFLEEMERQRQEYLRQKKAGETA